MQLRAYSVIFGCMTVWLGSFVPAKSHADMVITVTSGHARAAVQEPQRELVNIKAIPGNATLVDKTAWTGQRAETIKDMTKYVPSVFIQPRNGAESSRLSVRGSGLANTFQGRGLLILQDGIPINMADGEFEFPVIDPWLIAYAEVFPGANALEFGASNFGGAINFITSTGATEPNYTVRGEAGSFDTWHGLASAGQQWKSNDLFVAASDYKQDGFRRQNNQQTSRLNVNWGWQPNDHFANRVYLSQTEADAEIPGAVSYAMIKTDARQANPNNRAGHYQRNLDITRIADSSVWSDEDDRVETSLFYTYRTLDNPVTTYEFQTNNDIGIRAKYSHHYQSGQWLLGLNSYYGNADETRFQNIQGKTGNHILDRRFNAATNELYSQIDQQLYGRLHGITGIQGAYTTRDIKQSFPTTARQDTTYTGLSPRLGLRYDISHDSQIFGNISRSFEPPTWSELSGGNAPGFKRLDAQTGTTAEFGGRGRIANTHIQGAYYHGWLKNEFVNYRFANGDNATINAQHTKKDGVELAADGELGHDIFAINDSMTVRTAYTYSYFTLDHDPLYGNSTLPGVPRHYVRSELLYHHASGVSLGPNVEWSPMAAPVDLTNSYFTKPYAVFGMRTFWNSADQKTGFYIEARNVFNTSYAATYNVIPSANGTDGRYFYPGEGRSVYAGLHIRF